MHSVSRSGIVSALASLENSQNLLTTKGNRWGYFHASL